MGQCLLSLSLSRSLGTGWEHLCCGVEMCFQQPHPAAGPGAAGGARVGLGEPAWAGTAPSLPSPRLQQF